ncbi:MAG: lysophospholipid acyltransferase family protein [Pyrinomonadaceae bacterium]
MPIQKDKVYQFASLSDYKLKQRILIRLADLTFYFLIKVLGLFTRFEVCGAENLADIKEAGKLPVLSLWHDRVFLGTYFLRDRGMVVMTSKSFDGEYIARFIQRFGFGAIRGSSSRGGVSALTGMVRSMRAGHPMAFTVDGPRGPRYKAKPGPVILAKKTGNPILPFVLEPYRCWTVNSWDKMQFPRPFTSALAIFGKPIYVDQNADQAEISRKLSELQRSLDDLTEQGKAWSGRKD